MNLIDLAKLCVNAINQTHKIDIPGAAPHIYLQMPPQKAERPTRRLVPIGKSPVGRVISRGDVDVVAFEAIDVLAWCVAASGGQIKVEGK